MYLVHGYTGLIRCYAVVMKLLQNSNNALHGRLVKEHGEVLSQLTAMHCSVFVGAGTVSTQKHTDKTDKYFINGKTYCFIDFYSSIA